MSQQPTLEKSDSLGTKSRRKLLWDYLGGRRSKQTRGIQCGMSERGLVLTELQIAIRSRLLFQTTKSQENREEFERRVWLFIWTIVRCCKYTRECGHGECGHSPFLPRLSPYFFSRSPFFRSQLPRVLNRLAILASLKWGGGGGEYCSSDLVTRSQTAVYLNY